MKLSEVAVHKCSSKSVFLKISQYSQKTPVFESLFNKAAGLKACNFIKKEIPSQVFSCEYWEIFKNNFFVWTLSVHYTFLKLYVIIELFGYHKIDVFHISCTIVLFTFINLVLKSGVHGYFVLVFIPEFSVSVTFSRITTSAPTLFWLNPTSPSNLLWKMWIWDFWILCFATIFFRSCLAVMAKNNPTEKQIDVQIQATLKHGPACKLAEEYKVYRDKLQR